MFKGKPRAKPAHKGTKGHAKKPKDDMKMI